MQGLALQYAKYGLPSATVELVRTTVLPKKLGPDQVLLKFIAAPINPSDYNAIEGKYPVRPPLPAVGGNEGSARILEVGPDVRGLRAGDTVIPAAAGFGTWRSHAVASEQQVKKLPTGLSTAASAMFAVNPCTAYRMIEDFKKPEAGGWLIQNGANSGVGRAVIQLCRAQGIHTVNIIRDRADADSLKSELLASGADAVFIASQRGEIEQFCAENTPKLALNMVGGRDTIQLLKCLGEDGRVVTYGAMSNSPLSVPFGLAVFKNITLHAYWMTRWSNLNARSQAESEMFERLGELFRSGELQPTPHKENSFFDFEEALDCAYKRKQLFVVEKSLGDQRNDGL